MLDLEREVVREMAAAQQQEGLVRLEEVSDGSYNIARPDYRKQCVLQWRVLPKLLHVSV